MELAFALAFAGIAALGLIPGRRSVLLLPLVVWPALYSGIGAGVIGDGLGDGWAVSAAVLTVSSVAATAACVAAGGRLRARRRTTG